MVQNLDSGIVHEVLVGKHPLVPMDACRTVCGWKWALARHGVVGPPDINAGPRCHTCSTRKADASSGSESQEADTEEEGI